MRPFRSPALLRLLATVLVVGVASTLAPTAVAHDARAVSIRSLLNDAEAFETALAASRSARVDPVGVFADAYVEATGGALSAETVRQLLDGQSMGLVAPVVPDEASAPSSSAAPTPPASAAGVLLDLRAPATVRAGVSLATTAWVASDRPETRQLHPRAP